MSTSTPDKPLPMSPDEPMAATRDPYLNAMDLDRRPSLHSEQGPTSPPSSALTSPPQLPSPEPLSPLSSSGPTPASPPEETSMLAYATSPTPTPAPASVPSRPSSQPALPSSQGPISLTSGGSVTARVMQRASQFAARSVADRLPPVGRSASTPVPRSRSTSGDRNLPALPTELPDSSGQPGNGHTQQAPNSNPFQVPYAARAPSERYALPSPPPGGAPAAPPVAPTPRAANQPLLPSALYAQSADKASPSYTSFAQLPAPPPPREENETREAQSQPQLQPAGENPGLQLHPDFSRDGDVMIVASGPEGRVGFLVARAALARVSPVFAASIRLLPPTHRIPMLTVAEGPSEMTLLLFALVHGAVGAPRGPRPPPTVGEYLTLQRLYTKYAVRPFLLNMLVHCIAQRGFELSAPLANPRIARSEVAPFLRLATACRSPRLWECALRHAKTWQYFVNPWRMDENQVAEIGEEAYAVLLALEALRTTAGESGYTNLRVVYNADGKPGVSRTRESDAVFYVEDIAGGGHGNGTIGTAAPN